MAVKVACRCGQEFEALEELAGKTFRCPKCDSRLRVPHQAKAKPPVQMIACQCGQEFEALKELAGKTFRCPKCDSRLRVPHAEPAELPAKTIACPCGQEYAFKAHLAGKTLKCSQCGSPLKIPSATEPAEPSEDPEPILLDEPIEEPELILLDETLEEPAASGGQLLGSGGGSLGLMDDLLGEAGLDGQSPPKTCPSCRVVLPRNAVVCVQCGYDLQTGQKLQMVQAEPGSARRRSSGGGSLLYVRWGLSLMVLGIALGILSLLLGGFLLMQAMPTGSPDRAQTMAAIMGTMGLPLVGILVAAVLDFIGRALCLGVPRASGARGLIVAALALSLVNAFARSINMAERSPETGIILVLSSFGSMVIFQAFLKQLAEYIGRSDLADNASTLIKGSIALFCLIIGFAGLIFLMFRGGLGGAVIVVLFFGMILVLLVMGLCLFVLHIRLLVCLVAATGRQTRR